MSWDEYEYLDYMWHSPMTDGEEIRSFLNDVSDETETEERKERK